MKNAVRFQGQKEKERPAAELYGAESRPFLVGVGSCQVDSKGPNASGWKARPRTVRELGDR